jgi:hypothetical protein
MTDTSVAAADFATDDFRLGSIISRSGGVLSRHFPTFFLVMLVAYSPTVLIEGLKTTIGPAPVSRDQAYILIWVAAATLLGSVLVMVLSTVGCASLMQATFQDMGRRPVRLADSLNVALRRFWPLIGVVLVAGFLVGLGSRAFWFGWVTGYPVGLGLGLLIIPGLILYTMWFAAVPVCIVERCGPWTSLRRSRELTQGHRWKLFVLALLLLVVNVGSSLVAYELPIFVGPIAEVGGRWIWTAIWTAFSAIIITVTYYDLRVIKERVDIDQITAVFD